MELAEMAIAKQRARQAEEKAAKDKGASSGSATAAAPAPAAAATAAAATGGKDGYVYSKCSRYFTVAESSLILAYNVVATTSTGTMILRVMARRAAIPSTRKLLPVRRGRLRRRLDWLRRGRKRRRDRGEGWYGSSYAYDMHCTVPYCSL
jgi:hypothetical protein